MAAKGRVVAIGAKPEPINIDLSRSAILVIDMQNDFGAKGGMFDRAGIDITPIRQAVGPTVRVLAAARQASVPIIYLKQEHCADLSDAGGADSPHPDQTPTSVCGRCGASSGWHCEPHSRQGHVEYRDPA